MKSTALFAIAMAALTGIACDSEPSPAASIPPLVTPSAAPTYRLQVHVITMGTPCSGCVVEITSAPAAGMSATTAEGRATFDLPAPGVVELRASKDGYRTATATVTVENSYNPTYQSVRLESDRPAIDLAGMHTLEVRAAAACSQLPDELRVRTYPVSLAGWGSAFTFRAYSADNDAFVDFLMWVGVSVDNAFLVIENWTNERDGIIERLPAGGTLRIHLWSSVVPASNPDAISTPIEGTISYCDASSNCIAICESKNHQLTLTRR